MGLQVIGQQVEDAQSAATLWMTGVDYIQGNLVQRPADDLHFDFDSSVL
jgi:EAL domain-containing protein (putative c-di-GMP-specific phosphodiesterase class I)